MTLRIALTVDEEESADLIALLAKALGRGELGLLDLRIDVVTREHVMPPIPLRKPKQEPPLEPPKKRRNSGRKGKPHGSSPGLGGARFVIVREFAQSNGGQFTHGDAQTAIKAAGFAGTGMGSALKIWIGWKLIEKTGSGTYRLVDKKPDAEP